MLSDGFLANGQLRDTIMNIIGFRVFPENRSVYDPNHRSYTDVSGHLISRGLKMLGYSLILAERINIRDAMLMNPQRIIP